MTSSSALWVAAPMPDDDPVIWLAGCPPSPPPHSGQGLAGTGISPSPAGVGTVPKKLQMEPPGCRKRPRIGEYHRAPYEYSEPKLLSKERCSVYCRSVPSEPPLTHGWPKGPRNWCPS